MLIADVSDVPQHDMLMVGSCAQCTLRLLLDKNVVYITLEECFTMHTFCDHIKNKLVISFSYKGTTRVVEPHLLGHDKDGDLTLSAWQLSGGSGQGFRYFHVSKISGVATTGKNFEYARSGYNPNDQTMSRVACRL